jgi:nifR3 family TIM-barrel protein
MKAYDLVDINCGCPSDRIMNNASGCILLKNPQKIASFIKVLKNENLTVTAKVRLGLKKNNVLEIAKAAEKAGADALTIHARLASQGYDVPADWTWIAKVKKEVGIPVIGNGDVNSGAKAKEMLEIADGAMIARAAIGNPLIFKQILHYLKTGKEHEPSFKDNLAAFKEYLELAERHSIIDISRIKYLGSNFIRDVKGAAKMRQDLMQKKSFNEIKEFAKLL